MKILSHPLNLSVLVTVTHSSLLLPILLNLYIFFTIRRAHSLQDEMNRRAMSKEARAQVKVRVGVEVLWKTLSKDLRFVLPKLAPNLVRDVELLEGDGGLGTILLFHFGPDVSNMTEQKEKIVELDKSQWQIGLQVIEGGQLNLGFTSYGTFFKLTGIGDSETLVDIKVRYDAVMDDESLSAKTTSSTLVFIKYLEDYLLKTSE